MKKRFLLVFLLVVWLPVACNLTTLIGRSVATETPAVTSTFSPTPTPTVTPTPLPAVRVHQGDDALFNGDYELALQEYGTAFGSAAESETQAAALTGMGRAHYLLGSYAESVSELERVVQDYPQSYHLAAAYYFLGRSHSALGSHAQAAEAYSGYLAQRPGTLDAYIHELRGDALVSAGEFTAAIAAYEASIEAPRLGDSTRLAIKIGRTYSSMGDDINAVRKYLEIYEATNNDYVKAQMNLLAGRAYLNLGLPEQAYARFQDSVANYPLAYDSYTGLVELVNAGQPVNELWRGLVDYFAGQYGVAVNAFNRYLEANPEHDGTAHHYKALSLRALGQYQEAVVEWDALIDDHAGDRFWVKAWEEKALTQWAYLERHSQAAQTLDDFVRLYPDAAEAPGYLFNIGRILERKGDLSGAAEVWERLINEYPNAETSYRGLFLAGITRYRLGDFVSAQTIFQRCLVLAVSGRDQSMAYLWVGKSQQKQGNEAGARDSWEQAALRDPTGYYSERARELLLGREPFSSAAEFDLGYDLERERAEAEAWLREYFNIPLETDLSGLGPLAADERIRRGTAFWELGLHPEALNEFEALRKDILQDVVSSYRLLNHLNNLGFYRLAILTSRQILTLANMDDVTTFNAPVYFNHIRFGAYFRELVLPAAEREGFHPFFLFSIIRQESLFEGFIESSAGARGLMQIMPATGQEIVSQIYWPPDYRDDDLYRPMVNVRLGARYLARQRDFFNGNLYAALAGYNGGPGNTMGWINLAPDDPDLFLEVIRFDETRRYITQVAEFMHIYRRLYEGTP